jgi:hypothetical protein
MAGRTENEEFLLQVTAAVLALRWVTDDMDHQDCRRNCNAAVLAPAPGSNREAQCLHRVFFQIIRQQHTSCQGALQRDPARPVVPGITCREDVIGELPVIRDQVGSCHLSTVEIVPGAEHAEGPVVGGRVAG